MNKMEIKVYIANLGKYNEGILQGDWFTLPVDIEEMKEKIGINEQYEEWAIHDYEAPFHIMEYSNLERLNEIAEEMAELSENEVEAVCALMDNMIANNWEEAFEMVEDGRVIFYHDCQNMADVAEQFMEETGQLEQLPDNLKYYIDYEKMGRDMEIEGTFIELSDNIIMEYIG